MRSSLCGYTTCPRLKGRNCELCEQSESQLHFQFVRRQARRLAVRNSEAITESRQKVKTPRHAKGSISYGRLSLFAWINDLVNSLEKGGF